MSRPDGPVSGPVVRLPPWPRPVPDLVADADRVHGFAADLLAASTQVEDLGGFLAGQARPASWTGRAAAAYDEGLPPLRDRTDAMSLTLRSVARRVDAHAEALADLERRRADLTAEHDHLRGRVAALQAEVAAASAGRAGALQAACDDCAAHVQAFETDLERWVADLEAEERDVRDALSGMLGPDQVPRRHGGRGDPADAALARAPGTSATPFEVRAWWDSLTRAEQLAVIAAAPAMVGNRHGVPAADRDAANRLALAGDLARWGLLEEQGLLTDREQQWLTNARAAQEALDVVAGAVDLATGEPVPAQLYAYDPAAFDGDGAVAVAAGDLGAADNVAVVVPGLGTDGGSAPYQAERALRLHEAARALDPAETNASLFWIGYDAPDNVPWTGEGWDAVGVVSPAAADAGGERLADAVAGLRAAGEHPDGGAGSEPAHVTVIGYSYGSTTAAHAAVDGLVADDLVLLGSPGAGDADHAADLGMDPGRVWVGANSRDPIADLGNHGWFHLGSLAGAGLGHDPAEDDFGAQRFRAESTTRAPEAGLAGLLDHGKYFDHDTESLWNLGQIVNGDVDEVVRAEPVSDPWWGPPVDPEWDRPPTAPETDGG